MGKFAVSLLVLVVFVLTSCGDPQYVHDLGIDMIPVVDTQEGVSFEMGSDGGLSGRDEAPVHPVELNRPYEIAAHEITLEQFLIFLNDRSISEDGLYKGIEVLAFNSENRPFAWQDGQFRFQESEWMQTDQGPAVNMTWYGAALFCNWLSSKAGLQACYDISDWTCDPEKSGYRLPTEAEWEYASSGGSNGSETMYSGSNDVDLVAWFGCPSPMEVGQKQPNEIGLYDMSGNVWEWVNDYYSSTYYDDSPLQNPSGPQEGRNRVHRGGCWSSYSTDCERVSKRGFARPYEGGDFLGFRVARTSR